jgi:hypothetical protein
MAVPRLGIAGLLLLGCVLCLRSEDVAAQSLGWLSLTTLLLLLDGTRRGVPPVRWSRLLPRFLVPVEPVEAEVGDRTRFRRRLPEVWFTWSLRQGWQMRQRQENPPLRRNPRRVGGLGVV